MSRAKGPPNNWRQWIEYFWLIMSNPTFRTSRDRRKAYYEHCLARGLNRPWS
jgi:hypothetical protein